MRRMSEWLREEIDACAECSDAKRVGFIPGLCQRHLDMVMEEKEQGDKQ